MADPNLRDDGKNPSGSWRRTHTHRRDSRTLPDVGEVERDFSRSRSTRWGPKQRGQQKASRAYLPGQPRPQREEKDFYMHHRGVSTRWRQSPTDSVTEESGDRIQQDPLFNSKVGILYKLIRAQHHMNQVIKDTPPVFINNLTLTLSKKIMPAMTSDIIKKEIWMNAKNWKQETLSSLKTHYDRVIKEQLNNFYNLPDHEWRHPFKVAIKWAKTNLGQRLQQHTITQTEKLLADGLKKTELSMLRSGQVQTSTPRQRSTSHSPFNKGLLWSPGVQQHNLINMEKSIYKLTCLLENFKGWNPPEKEEEKMIEERNTQTERSEPTTNNTATQTEAPRTENGHTQTRSGKRQTRSVVVQFPPPPQRTVGTRMTTIGRLIPGIGVDIEPVTSGYGDVKGR